MHQRDIVEYGDSELVQVPSGRFVEEVVILGAKYVSLPDYRSLHHHDVVHISDRRCHKRVQVHNFGGLAEEIDVIENKVLGQVVKRLQAGITQNLGEFAQHLV